MKKIVKLVALVCVISLVFCACKGDSTVGEDRDDSALTGTAEAGGVDAPDDANVTLTDNVDIKNFVMPEIGEDIAVMTVKDYGTIKIKLFPVEAAKGVENFVGLSNIDYYDELIFHRVIKNFMNQGGDPRGDGTGGSSMWGDDFDGGIPEGLYHFSGAIAYANSGGTNTNGSQFYIVNTPEGYVNAGAYQQADGSVVEVTDIYQSGLTLPANVAAMYEARGGVPFLDGSYTVFGQVFEGMDVVRAIGNTQTDENDKPLTQVLIEDISIVPYEG
ncbi:MAG: peptidylprolyl isomerase [Ruminococcus sp.]|jgi:cyclophilin family peptidyl-prolyl cis-trans isomerase|nr:peptidylprolyl isomerase [Ruminococcus sp.]